jgi:glycine/D-amino acid oxidase-like deaminating enzyme/nitrite reductase/ring-hydroxylating ferredoxin subunit
MQQSKSIWNGRQERREVLTKDAKADVCIVGAGIAGLTTAYLLSQEGRSVVVLDDGPIGGGETGRTTAHLSNAIDDRYFLIERMHGPEGARICAESHTQAIDTVEDIVNVERIECDFRRLNGYLFLPPGESEDVLKQEWEAVRRAGLQNVEYLERAPLKSYDTGPCLCFPRQGQFDPLKYLEGLSRRIEERDGRIFVGTHVDQVLDVNSLTVETSSGFSVRASAVVVATNTPFIDLFVLHTKQAAYRTYVIAGRIPIRDVTEALYWDTSDTPGNQGSYHYVRLKRNGFASGGAGAIPQDQALLVVGGEDHKTGQADDAAARWDRLEQWTRERFPTFGEVEYRWSGQVMEPVDGVAYIGRNPLGPKHVYVATGDSGMGITHGTIAGILLTDLISDRSNPWQELYDPSRKTVRSAWEFASENLNVAAHYADWVSAAHTKGPQELACGEGAVIRRGLQLLATYRDDTGRLHERSAVCPHLGCIVAWNSAEKTWDCPCHGSRFDAQGAVVNAPAHDPLATVK